MVSGDPCVYLPDGHDDNLIECSSSGCSFTSEPVARKITTLEIPEFVKFSLEGCGFYFRQKTETFECFGCGAKVELWNTDTISLEFKHFSGCDECEDGDSMIEITLPRCVSYDLHNYAKKAHRDEDTRLLSFLAWKSFDCDFKRFSKTGFYYTGTKDKIKCAFCQMTKENWTPSDDPERVHKELSPDCPLLKGEDCGNSPATISFPKKTEKKRGRNCYIF